MEDNNTSSSAGGASIKHEDPSVTLTIRLIMQGKEVGSIIGKKGEIVNRFREESGAKINISDGSCPERIVTVSGTTNAIFSAFTLITKKFEEVCVRVCSQFNDVGKVGKTQIPIRLIVPGQSMWNCLMAPEPQRRRCTPNLIQSNPFRTFVPLCEQVAKNPLASLAALGLAGMNPASTGGINHTAALAALAGSQLRTANPANRAQQQQHEMTVSNDLIGCIIGKGGTKIAEIRQISGAMIRISNCEEREGGNTDRTITISGNPDSVALAQYLINMRISMETAGLPIPGYHYIAPSAIVKTPIH
ncbi:GM22416 [Drosophila sechellia]|uniref:GM22416 n=1 Tax=Drosophila sechellia TaxID=7238 RepID=B4IAX1_DROSE|nr:GM22416 [Drosophila sechellia]